MNAPPSTTIRALRQADEFRAVEALQRDVWGFDEIEIVPLHVLMTAARHGGVVLGAFEGSALVGFSFGFRGVDADGSSVVCSHLLAVAPGARGRGLGLALKWAQRDAALAAGLGRIVWTFDPLEHGNARLNLNRLGGVSDRYVVDLYGELRDELNAGLPTDRIEIVWELASPRVRTRAEGRSTQRHDPGPVLNPDGPEASAVAPADAPTVRLIVPEDAQRLRRGDPAAALAWRMHVREALTALFGAGYLLVGAGHGAHGAELRLAHRDTAPLDDG